MHIPICYSNDTAMSAKYHVPNRFGIIMKNNLFNKSLRNNTLRHTIHKLLMLLHRWFINKLLT